MRLSAREPMGHAAGLRNLRRGRRRRGPRRRGDVRRQRRHGRAGALLDGVLQGGVLWQVHPLPHWLDPWRRGDRPHSRRRRSRGQPRAAQRSLRHDGGRLALRHGRHDPLPGTERVETLPPATSSARRMESNHDPTFRSPPSGQQRRLQPRLRHPRASPPVRPASTSRSTASP